MTILFTHRFSFKNALLVFFPCFLLFLFSKNSVFGQFSTPLKIDTAIGIKQIETLDFDADGDQDILVLTTNKTFKWYENQSANFKAAKEILFLSADFATIIDFDLDGDKDIVAGNHNQYYWYRNEDGKGNFGAAKIIAEQIAPNDRIYVLDLDDDGDLDVCPSINQINGNKIVWHRNEGNQIDFTKKFHVLFGVGQSPDSNGVRIESISMVDWDKNGKMDFLAKNVYNSPTIQYHYVLLNFGNGNFSTHVSGGLSNQKPAHTMLQNFDLDHDGYQDLLEIYNWTYLTGSYETKVRFYPKHQYGGEIETLYVPSISVSWTSPTHNYITALDIDNDSDLDMVATCYNQLKAYQNDGHGVFQPSIVFYDSPSTTYQEFSAGFNGPISTGDFDGDNFTDVLCRFKNKLVWLKNAYNLGVILEGDVFLDENENGKKDSTEINLLNQKVELLPIGTKSWGNLDKSFRLTAPLGNLELSCKPDSIWSFTTDSIYKFTLFSDTIVNRDFGLKPKTPLFSAAIDMSSAPTRCGFTVPFWLNIKNTGNQKMDGIVALPLDSLVTFVSAEPAPDSIVGNTIYWHFTQLDPTYSFQILLNFQVAGVQYLGKYIYLYPKTTFFDENGLVSSVVRTQFLSQINCSVDPNDKLVQPDISGDKNYVLTSEELIYTIRFQNTGTDTAFTVKITDQLDPDFNPESFRMIAASHDYTLTLERNGLLTFQFDSILLPDDKTNEPFSHGFVKFGIRSACKSCFISNQASIYFDFNPPILTNVVKNEIKEKQFEFYLTKSCPDKSNGKIDVINLFQNNVDLVYEWSPLLQNSSIALNLDKGFYPLKITDKFSQRVLLDTIFQLELAPLPNFTVVSTPSLPNSNTGSASVIQLPPLNYNPKCLWSTNPPKTTATITNLPAGVYTVTVTNGHLCTATASVTVENTVATTQISGVSTFEILPNPSDGHLKINLRLDFPTDFQIKIFNEMGILQQKFTSKTAAGLAQNFKVENLPTGIYFVKLEIGQKIWTQKVIVQN